MSSFDLDVNVVLYHPDHLERRLQEDLPRLTGSRARFHILDNSNNELNLAAAWNDLGFRGNAPYVGFLHSDICVSRDWDLPLIEYLTSHPEMGVVLPNPGGRWDLLGRQFKLSTPPSPEELDAWSSWARTNMSGKHTTYATSVGDTAVFFCAVMRRRDWEALKGFDERVRFVGVNTEFERRMSERGLHTAMVHASSVWHQDAKSFFKAKSIGAFRDDVEGRNWNHWDTALRTGKTAKWHDLPDAERAAVRRQDSFRIGSSRPFPA